MTPREAAPTREDVTQADRDAARGWLHDVVHKYLANRQEMEMLAEHFARHRLAHTARPDAAPNLNDYIAGYEDAQEVAARPDAGDEVERVARALCKQQGGDADAHAVDSHDCWEGPLWTVFAKDAEELLSAMREGVDRGMVERVEAEARRYAGMYSEASDGRNTFVMFADWVAALSRKGG
ncbi:hypothetical protein GCM10008023_05550 [Sphingomonas glacialis]|uniref:Uncharacterized protein n=1 Tax=Sphingomonas glacialis TaxID=658225 RepID=A0ABQ3LF16_9SPHN|nr:hypothetical protein [Sphingomonas glacialis]GHH09203.1 hypothetical protein GCM10008023_05550 [Sphingomonas glacialis]